MSITKSLKIVLIKCNVTLTEVVKRLNTKNNTNDSIQNLSKKINKGTLKYNEAVQIAEVLGYKIEWIPLGDK